MNTVKLNNGIEMPILGYGVYQVSSLRGTLLLEMAAPTPSSL